MRTFFLIISLTLCCIAINAKEKYIFNDDVNVEGYRTITSDSETLYTSNWGFMTKHNLVCVVCPNGTKTFFLMIKFNGEELPMKENSALLLKLGNGELIELKSNKVGYKDMDYVYTGIGSTVFTTALYEITEEQIEEIISNDVSKIRVQWDGGTFDKDIKKKKMSKLFEKAYPAILTVLKEQKSLYDNF